MNDPINHSSRPRLNPDAQPHFAPGSCALPPIAAHTPSPHAERALELLPKAQDVNIRLADLKLEPQATESESYATDPHGEPLSQFAFAQRYAQTVLRIAARAKHLLNSCAMDDLVAMRNDLMSAQIAHGTQLPDAHLRQSIQNEYERGIRTELVRLAECDDSDRDLNLRAANQAIMVLGMAEREARLKFLLANGGAARLEEYRSMMQEARVRAGHGDQNEVLYQYLHIVSARHHYFPEMKVFSDFDGYLTKVPESGSPYKPGEQTNSLVNAIDIAMEFPLSARLVTTECPGLNPALGEQAAGLYAIAAANSTFCFDTPVFLRQMHDENIRHTVLTANHAGLIEAKLAEVGLAGSEVIGMRDCFCFSNKQQMILLEMLESRDYGVYFFGDDNDSSLAAHIRGGSAGAKEAFGCESAWLPDLIFLAARGSDIRNFRIADTLREAGIPHSLNSALPNGRGLIESNRLVRQYCSMKVGDWADPSQLTMPVNYRTSAIIKEMRERLLRNAAMPMPSIRTVVRPNQDLQKCSSPEGNRQYDLGAPTATYIRETGQWLIMYKSADGPSGWPLRPAVSNVFAAIYDPKTGAVEFLDKIKGKCTQDDIYQYISSSLPAELHKDGLHDPRASTIRFRDGHEETLVFCCAFNKEVEKESMTRAAGDLNIPIRGAVTEAFITSTPLDAQSYISLGQFGPDFHFKNIVAFPETFMENGKEVIKLLTRKMPGIQITTVSLEELKSFGSDPVARTKFWNNVVSPETVKANTVINPQLLHEGWLNPESPSGEGQIAPGLPPIHVTLEEDGEMRDYWLAIYNSVPDYRGDSVGRAEGRTINAALLDYNDPGKLVSRSPLPIIVGRTDRDFYEEETLDLRHPDIAFCGGGGIDSEGRLVVVYTENDTIVRAATWDSAEQLVRYIEKFDHNGAKKRPSFPCLEGLLPG